MNRLGRIRGAWLALVRAWATSRSYLGVNGLRWRARSLGQRGELAAARYLQRLGYRVVARGQRDRLGELDLIAIEGSVVVFVEVKTRTSHDAGHPAEAVNADKQRRLTRAALTFLKRHDLLDCPARFDVVAITWPDPGAPPTIEHYRHAFEAVGRGQMYS